MNIDEIKKERIRIQYKIIEDYFIHYVDADEYISGKIMEIQIIKKSHSLN